jgi:putative ABC transport system permease protein
MGPAPPTRCHPPRGRFWTGPYGREDEPPEAWTRKQANFRSITPGYFAAIGARLLAGRALTRDDLENERRVAVVDELLAQRLWPEDALHEVVGRRVGADVLGTREILEVVGVVAPIRHAELDRQGTETIYFPFHLYSRFAMTVMVRAAGDPAELVAAARQIVSELDPDRPIYAVRTMTAAVGEAIAPQRFAWVLIAVFAGAAVVLAAVGIHGVLSYAVRQRTAEIGVRMALGAGRGTILRQVVGRSLALTGLGIALGLVAAAALSRVLAGLFFAITPIDPATYAALAVLLALVALVASFIPAWRASRIDPMAGLRTE